MARIKGGMNARRKHNKVLKLAKGYRGARSKQYRVAKQSVMRSSPPPMQDVRRESVSSDSCGSPVSTLLQESTACPTASSCTA